MKKVSIIIPVYNAVDGLPRCLDSILRQKYEDMEILCINDGSTDKSLEVLQAYEKKDLRIKVVDKANEGVALTRNLGIQIAIGEYLMFVDNDDFLDENYVETYFSHLDQDYDIIIGGWRRTSSTGKLIYERPMKGSEWESYINIYPWDKLYKRQFLVENEIQFLNYGIGEDMYFTLRAKAEKPRIKLIPYVGYTWYYNEESVSNTSHKGLNQELDILYLLNKINSLFEQPPEFLKYYYKRFLVWYLLYSGRKATKKDFLAENKKVVEWVKENQLKPSITAFSPKLIGEKPFERLSVLVISTLQKLHFMGLFATIYCKGK